MLPDTDHRGTRPACKVEWAVIGAANTWTRCSPVRTVACIARRKISNELWTVLQPLIPEFEPSPNGGRRRSVDDRAALNGILFVLQSGIPWEDLPWELGFGSGMTCWRRLREWQAAGGRLHVAMLRRLREHDQIDWGRASIDGASPGAGNRSDPNRPGPIRREVAPYSRRLGCFAGDHRERCQSSRSMMFEPTLDAIPAVPGLNGGARKRRTNCMLEKNSQS